ncbi:hypothetical protein CHELA1G11_21357 [Hyphomicrobiales bacterium]|nr:hypothetical protein CHELA1G11_21357 [Hyphomicrobiales bacterium]CAH1694344.1 hypothetical protein CHELA1G2_21662 [Hyphomicrobiales bacterium]
MNFKIPRALIVIYGWAGVPFVRCYRSWEVDGGKREDDRPDQSQEPAARFCPAGRKQFGLGRDTDAEARRKADDAPELGADCARLLDDFVRR